MPNVRTNQPLYDTVRLAASAAQTVTFFTVPHNGALASGVAKTYQHTNLRTPNRLEPGQVFQIKGMILFPHVYTTGTTTRTTWADTIVLQGGWIDIKLNDNQSYFRLPVAMIPAGGGNLSLFSNITAAATEWTANRGAGHVSNEFPLEGLNIGDGENFTVEMTVPGTIGAVTDVTFAFMGTFEKFSG